MMRSKPKRPRRSSGAVFVTFEGIEGSGKTTQLARLAKYLREQGYRALETREPGGTPIAEQIRDIMLNPARNIAAEQKLRRLVEPISSECEAALVLAARAQHVSQVIYPALEEGTIVLCDRFSDSTLAYQGYARGLDIRMLKRLNDFATRGLTPDLTLLFDLPVDTGLARRRHRGADQNRLDRETRQFHIQVRKGFLDLAAREPGRVKVIDARPDPDRIAADVATAVDTFFKKSRKAVRS